MDVKLVTTDKIVLILNQQTNLYAYTYYVFHSQKDNFTVKLWH